MKSRRQTRQAPAPATGTPGAKPILTAGMAAVIYFALAVIYFLPALMPGRMLYGSDYMAGGFYFYEFISQRLAAGDLPKWVPHIYGGLPLISNPGSTYYPIYMIGELIFPVAKMFPILFIIQFTLAGIGGYFLARELGCRPWVALIAGLAYEFTGLVMSFVLGGHDGRIIVATLAPLFFAFLHRGVRTGSIAAFVGAAAVLGGALMSFQIQSNYYMLLGGGAWGVFLLFHFRLHKQPGILLRRAALGLAAVAFGFALSAVDYLPFIDYVEASPRAGEGRGYEYATSWAMAPAEISGFAVPEQAGLLEHYQGANPFKLHTEYVGAFVVLMFAVGFWASRRNRYWWFFLGLTAFMLSIAFGGHTPLYRLYYEVLPATKRFRAPSISLFVAVLSLVAMAAVTLESLAQRLKERLRPGEQDPLRPAVWIIAGVVGFALLGAMVASASGAGIEREAARARGWFRFFLFAAAIGGTLAFWLLRRIGTRTAAAVVALLTVFDLGIIAKRFFEVTPGGPEMVFAADDVVQFLASQPDRPNRVWVFPGQPSYARGAGNYLMRFDIQQAGGEHPNMLQRWNEFVGAGEASYVDWHNFVENPTFMNAAAIRYLIVGGLLEAPGFREVYRGSAVVYENMNALPHAYLVPRVAAAPGEDGALTLMRAEGFDPRQTAVVSDPLPTQLPDTPLEGDARIQAYGPDEVTIATTANRAALLVLADNHYDGWEAEIDGAATPIVRTNHTFRGVVVPEGSHTVVFRYRPADLFTGAWISAIGWGLVALLAVGLLLRRRKRPQPSTG